MDMTVAHSRFKWALDYNNKIGYHTKVTENENMVSGLQWEGVKSNGLSTPVFNIEKRIMDYKIAACASQRVKAVYGIEGISQYGDDVSQDEIELGEIARLMSGNAEVRWEKLKMDFMIRKWLRDGFVTGDMFAHTYWDDSIKTGQKIRGDFVTERVHGGNVFFGNPNDPNPQVQPWIIILIRDTIQHWREKAKKAGVKREDIDRIVSDSKTDTQIGKYGQIEMEGDNSTNKCNGYLMYYRKEDGYIYRSLSTEYVVIEEEISTKLTRYPIDHGVWDESENCYHGRAECTEIHPNQRFINKMFALCMIWFTNNAFGKTAIDQTRVTNWTNDVASVVRVNGPVDGVIQQLSSGNFNSAVMMIIDYAIRYTKEAQGVTDAAIGQERADNTSALIVAQKASALPLENQQARMFQFIEDIYLTWAEFMVAYYLKDRKLPIKDHEGNIIYKQFSPSDRDKLIMNVKIDVGASSYWSEIATIDTLDKLLQQDRITMIQYLERLPSGYITNKQKLIEEMKAIAEATSDGTEVSQEEQYEQMAQFLEGLPYEVQQQLRQMPPEQMEAELMSMMTGAPVR